MRTRRRRFKLSKALVILAPFAMIIPLIAQAVPMVFQNNQAKVEELKYEKAITPKVQVTPTPLPKKPEPKIEPKVTPTPEPKPIQATPIAPNPVLNPAPIIIPTPNPTPKPQVTPTPTIPNTNPSMDAVYSCNVSDDRPLNSRWIYKNKSVGEGVRYTADIYEINNPKNVINTKVYFYVLHDKITRYAKTKTIANFAISYRKPKANDKNWDVEFNSCGLDAKIDLSNVLASTPDIVSSKSIPLVMVYGDNDNQLLKTARLTGFNKPERIGQVLKPNTSIRVLSQLDITEEK
jgi:hypothetical protein